MNASSEGVCNVGDAAHAAASIACAAFVNPVAVGTERDCASLNGLGMFFPILNPRHRRGRTPILFAGLIVQGVGIIDVERYGSVGIVLDVVGSTQ